MTEHRDKWMAKMIQRYGSEQEVKLEMKRRQEKSMLNPSRQKGNHRGGFNALKEQGKLKELQDKGRETQRRNRESIKQAQEKV